MATRDQDIRELSAARLDLPGELVIALHHRALCSLQISNLLITNLWTIRARDGGDVAHTVVRVIANQQMRDTGIFHGPDFLPLSILFLQTADRLQTSARVIAAHLETDAHDLRARPGRGRA